MAIECKLLDFVVNDSDEFKIQMFGIDESRNTYSITIKDYMPFVYVRVSDQWPQAICDEFMNHLKEHDNTKNAYQFVEDYKVIERKALYGFDGGKMHKFIQIFCKNMKFIYALKQLYVDREVDRENVKTERVKSYVYNSVQTNIYESMVPPLLRFFHIQEISPSGWIRVEKFQENKKLKFTRCTTEIRCSYKDIISLNDKETPVPYKVCSFDIEASSSHGDFPEAIKNYKKVAYEMIYKLEEVPKEDYPLVIRELLLNVFGIKSSMDIDKCYPKKKVTENDVIEAVKKMLELEIKKNDKTEEKIHKYFKKVEDNNESGGGGDDDDEPSEAFIDEDDVKRYNHIPEYNTIQGTSDLVTMLTSKEIDTPAKIVYFMDVLDMLFPALEGDQVTFIGSTFVNYGEETPYLNHCICVNDTNRILDQHTLECYGTEREALCAWSELIRKEDPDIIIGYNIFGFDYRFMYDRATETNCVDEFMNLGRNFKYSKELEESSIVLASGPYELTRLPMQGRLQVDMYTYMRKDFNLTSYKLDYVAGYLLSDSVKKYENTGNTCRVWTKNLKGLEVGSYVHFEVLNHSCDMYEEGKKFKVLSMEKDGYIMEGNLNCSDKMNWGLAKDDVTHQDIFELTRKGPAERGIIAKYCIQDCNLVHHIFQKVDVLTTYIEMSKLCSVPINFLVMRGQGIKLTSYIAKKCREKDVLMPLISKGNAGDAYEGAIVLDPKCNLYLDNPVACVDYSSLYPSSIISENLSHDSKVWTKEFDTNGVIKKDRFGKDMITGIRNLKGEFIYDNLSGYKYVDIKYDTFSYRKTGAKAAVKVLTGYKICRYAQFPNDQKAILPSILMELLAARKKAKKQMEQETDPFKKNLYEKRQLSIKVTANSLYGQCGAKTSSFYEMDIAASTTATGRKLLIYGKNVIESVYGDATVDTDYGPMQTKAEYVYGDTDSVFFTFNLRQNGKKVDPQIALDVTIKLAQDAGHLATMFLKKPHDLEYEKTFLPFCLLSKKRYVGMLYETDPTSCKRKSMGIVLKRRDNAPIVKDVYGGIIDILMKDKDIDKSIQFLHNILQQITDKKVPIEKLIISKSLRSFYKKPQQIAHNVLAQRIGIRDPGNKPAPGDRIPYVYILNPSTKLQGEKIETPTFIQENKCKIDYGFYISNQIMKPVIQIYSLVLYDMKEFKRRKPAFLMELETLRQVYDAEDKMDKYPKKEQDMKNKEVEKILFESYLRVDKNNKAGNKAITSFFAKK
jgi:DNA polymerase elongation subunit (family B)